MCGRKCETRLPFLNKLSSKYMQAGLLLCSTITSENQCPLNGMFIHVPVLKRSSAMQHSGSSAYGSVCFMKKQCT